MSKKPARLAALITLLLFSAAAFAGLPDGQATTQNQTNANAKANSKSGDQKKPALPPKDADKLAKEDKLSKERYSTRGLHPPDKASDNKTQSGSSKDSQAAGKPDAKDPK